MTIRERAFQAIAEIPEFRGDPRLDGTISKYTYYDDVDSCPFFKNADNRPVLTRIRDSIQGGFWVLLYSANPNDLGAQIGGDILVFVDDETQKVIGVYPII